MNISDDTLISVSWCIDLLPGCERVTYIPRSGSRRQIKVVVSRPGDENLPGVENGGSPHFEILVKNDSVKGISSSEINTGGDKIEIAMRVAESPKSVRITSIINEDAGFMLVSAE